MINLLPEERKRQFKRLYLVRLFAVVLFAAAALLVIHSVLLVPSYVFLQARVLNQEAEKTLIGRNLKASGSEEVEARLLVLQNNIETLRSLKDAPSFLGAAEEVLAVSRTGIQITQIAYDPKVAEKQIAVRGIAADRDALQGFANRIRARETIETVDFPIGNLSRDKDLPFTISITVRP